MASTSIYPVRAVQEGEMMNQPPLNPDALAHAQSAAFDCWESGGNMDDLTECAIEAYFAVAQPEVTKWQELDKLPIGSVVIINGTMLQADDRDDYGTTWSRVRDIDAYPSEALALPARVLYQPSGGGHDGR